MKKEKIHHKQERRKPHIPEEGRQRIKGGGVHEDKKRYNKKDKKWKREGMSASRFFISTMLIFR
ncbi:MAG: hypothetical protein WCT49_05355 [Candidatus Paceibacterota bacterium]|jgi:hypothetical protein